MFDPNNPQQQAAPGMMHTMGGGMNALYGNSGQPNGSPTGGTAQGRGGGWDFTNGFGGGTGAAPRGHSSLDFNQLQSNPMIQQAAQILQGGGSLQDVWQQIGPHRDPGAQQRQSDYLNALHGWREQMPAWGGIGDDAMGAMRDWRAARPVRPGQGVPGLIPGQPGTAQTNPAFPPTPLPGFVATPNGGYGSSYSVAGMNPAASGFGLPTY